MSRIGFHPVICNATGWKPIPLIDRAMLRPEASAYGSLSTPFQASWKGSYR